MILLPIISVFMLHIVMCLYQRGNITESVDRTTAMLFSISLNTLLLLISNELLSLFHAITWYSLAILWFGTDVILVAIVLRMLCKYRIPLSDIEKCCFGGGVIPFHPLALLTAFVCCIAVNFALRTVPYNWDSMTYHLTRIVHWVQNRSIAHYVCHDISQISGPPLAEFVNLHVYILSGFNDKFVNLTQTFSYIILVYLIYKIAIKIGCESCYGWLASLVFATSPIVFGEALSTQVDMFSGLWLMIFVYVFVCLIEEGRLQWDKNVWGKLILMGLSAGFSYLAKPSVCIAAAVFALGLLIFCLYRKNRVPVVIGSVITVGVTAFLVILPEAVRNYITFHGISSPETSTQFLVPSLDIRYLTINMIHNIAYNCFPGDWSNVCKYVKRTVLELIYFFYGGKNKSPQSLLYFDFIEYNMGHDTAINPIIYWLLIIAMFCILLGIFRMLFKRRSMSFEKGYFYSLVSIASVLIFCAFVKWYTFITRYEIGYLAILAPAVMYVIQKSLKKRYLKIIFSGILFVLCFLTFEDAFQYHIDFVEAEGKREEQYFAVRDRYPSYREIADEISDNEYKKIGFYCGSDSYEYPLWKMLENQIDRFEHVCVDNETQIYDDINYDPECIIAVDRMVKDDVLEYHGRRYFLTVDFSDIKLFE